MSTTMMDLTVQHAPGIFGTSLTEKIRDYCDAIRAGNYSFPILHKNIVALEELIFAQDRPTLEVALTLSETAEERVELNNAYCEWETQLEARYAEDILAGRETTLDNYLLNKRFERLIERELSLVSGQLPQRVLFMGSGPLPISAFHIHKVTDRMVDCLDHNPEAVEISRQVIDRLGLRGAVRVFNGSGETFDISEYDLIVIALLAKPKRRILRHLRKHAAPGCRVLCRTSHSLRTIVYEPTAEIALGGFEVLDQQVAEGEQTISTLLLERAVSRVPNVRLRWLEEVNAPTGAGILRVMNRVLRYETTIGFSRPLGKIEGEHLMAKLDEDVKAGRSYVLVAEQDDKIVGQLILTPHRLPNCSHLLELSRGIIDPSFRGTGLAFSAFKEIAQKCDEIGGQVIYLDVRAGTLAAELWKSFGFVPFGKLPDYARVNGHKYDGLYLSQTVTSLKENLARISNRRKGPTLSGREDATVPEFIPYKPRRVRALPTFDYCGWRLKVYGINVEGRELDHALIGAAQIAAQDILPQPAVCPPDRYGIGFMIVHAARDVDFVVICWWGAQNELLVRVLTAPAGQPQRLCQHSNMHGPIGCVWDLGVICAEREAWVNYIMRPGGPDVDGYLHYVIDGEV